VKFEIILEIKRGEMPSQVFWNNVRYKNPHDLPLEAPVTIITLSTGGVVSEGIFMTMEVDGGGKLGVCDYHSARWGEVKAISLWTIICGLQTLNCPQTYGPKPL
jgi:hypothetical protein